MPDSQRRDHPDNVPPSKPSPGRSLPGTARLFPDAPPDQLPSSLDRSALSGQETRRAANAIEELEDKMLAVSLELAQFFFNDSEFKEIYTRYCEKKVIIERILAHNPRSDAWQTVVSDGSTSHLRQRYAARIEGMLILEIQSALVLARLGRFDLRDDILVPILSSLAGGKVPAVEAGARSTQIESGRWLSFVPGELCASVAIFSNEPSATQVANITSLHRDFERANRQRLMAGRAVAAQMTFPQRALFEEP